MTLKLIERLLQRGFAKKQFPMKTLIALLEDVRTQVGAAVKEDLTLEQTRKKVNLDKWKKQLAGDDRYRQRAFLDFFETPGIAQAYKEAKGESRDE